MMKTDKIFKFLGLSNEDESVDEEDLSLDEIFQAEIEEILAEMATEHGDTDRYNKLVENLNVLTKGYNEFKRAEAETKRVEAEKANHRKQQAIKIADTSLKILGLILSARMTMFYFGIERNKPIPVRYVQKCQDFLTKM